jgi:hypothetical protein
MMEDNMSPVNTTAHSAVKSELNDVQPRRAFVRRVVENERLEDIYSEDREERWSAFSPADQKRIDEGKVFVRFVKASSLAGDSFEYENLDPPHPDISAKIGGEVYYFELGEITDEGLARGVSVSEKTCEITGAPFSQVGPLMKMFRDKCAKSYTTSGAPLDLLL